MYVAYKYLGALTMDVNVAQFALIICQPTIYPSRPPYRISCKVLILNQIKRHSLLSVNPGSNHIAYLATSFFVVHFVLLSKSSL